MRFEPTRSKTTVDAGLRANDRKCAPLATLTLFVTVWILGYCDGLSGQELTPLQPLRVSKIGSKPTPEYFQSTIVPSGLSLQSNGTLTAEVLSEAEFKAYLKGLPLADQATSPEQTIRDPAVRLAGFVLSEEEGEKGDESGKEATVKAKPVSTSAIVEVKSDDLAEQIEEQRKLINENESIDEATKNDQLEQLNSAATWLQKAKNFEREIVENQKNIDGFEQAVSENEVTLKEMASVRQPDKNAMSDELQSQLQQKRQEIQEEKSTLDTIRSQIQQRDARIALIPGLKSTAQERLKKIELGFAELADKPDDVVKQLSTLALKAQELASRKEIDALNIEVEWQEKRAKLLPMQRDIANRNLNRLESEIESWNNAFNDRRNEEIEQQKEAAERALNETIKADRRLAPLAQRNQELADVRLELTQKIQDYQTELGQISDRTDDFADKFKSLREKIEKGMSPTDGMLLSKQRQSLMLPARSQIRISEIKAELKKSQEATLALKEEREPLALTEKYIESLQGSNTGDLKAVEFKKLAKELVETRLNYIDSLDKDYEDLRGLLVKISSGHDDLIKQLNDSRSYLNQNALWIQSSKPIGTGDFNESFSGVVQLSQSDGWEKLGGAIKNGILNRPIEGLFALVVLGGLFLLNRRMKDAQ